MAGTNGTLDGARPNAVSTWSGALHLEDGTNGARQRFLNCPFSGTDSCPLAWHNNSPVDNCCNTGNISAGTPFLMFSSDGETIVYPQEATEMYTALIGTYPPCDALHSCIKATKILLHDTCHAATCYTHPLNFSQGQDQLATDEGCNPGGTVTKATIDWFLHELNGAPSC